jgi:hypothetical protein
MFDKPFRGEPKVAANLLSSAQRRLRRVEDQLCPGKGDIPVADEVCPAIGKQLAGKLFGDKLCPGYQQHANSNVQ